MLTVTRSIKIEWEDCDPAGIVYFPRYFVFFDRCTGGIFEAVGFPKRELLKKYQFAGYPVVEARATFSVPSTYGDTVEVETAICEWGRTSFRVQHRLMKGATLAVEGFETRVWVGGEPSEPGGMKACPIPQDLIDRFK